MAVQAMSSRTPTPSSTQRWARLCMFIRLVMDHRCRTDIHLVIPLVLGMHILILKDIHRIHW